MARVKQPVEARCIQDTRGVDHAFEYDEGYCVPMCGFESPAYFDRHVSSFYAVPTCLWCTVALLGALT